MDDSITNQVIKLIDPIFENGYAGEVLDTDRLMTVLRRAQRINLVKEVVDWHIRCEKEGWRSQASVKIEWDESGDGRPYLPPENECLLDEDEKVIAEDIVETIDQYSSSEPKIDNFIGKLVKMENADSWSSVGWLDRLVPLASSVGFDVRAYYSKMLSEELDATVDPVATPTRPQPRM